MPAGAPTKYKPEYCQAAQDFMGQGYSLTAFAGSIDVCKDTVYEWEKTIPEFSDAIKRARDKRVMKLESDLMDAQQSAVMTSRIFLLKSAARHEYSEKQDDNGDSVVKLAEALSLLAGKLPG